MLADGCVEVDERSSKADCHPPDIIGGTKLVVNELRCGLMSLWLCAPVSRTVKTRPTGSGHADAQVCAGTASLSCRLTSHLADSRAVRLRHPAPWSFTGLVESANLSRVQTRCFCSSLGIVSAILVSDFRSPHTWLPTASMATAVRTNGLFSS